MNNKLQVVICIIFIFYPSLLLSQGYYINTNTAYVFVGQRPSAKNLNKSISTYSFGAISLGHTRIISLWVYYYPSASVLKFYTPLMVNNDTNDISVRLIKNVYNYNYFNAIDNINWQNRSLLLYKLKIKPETLGPGAAIIIFKSNDEYDKPNTAGSISFIWTTVPNVLTLNPGAGTLQVNNQSQMVFTVSNNTDSAKNIYSINCNGPFIMTNNCSAVLNVGMSCLISVKYSPPSILNGYGSHGNIRIISNDDAHTDVINLDVNEALPNISLNTNYISFTSVVIGTMSQSQNVIISNIGNGAANMNISIVGKYIMTNNCPEILNPSQSCIAKINFNPQEIGVENGALIFDVNNFIQYVPLSGNAIAPPSPLITSSSQTLSFGSENVGYSSISKSISFHNDGAINGDAEFYVAGDFNIKNNTCQSMILANTSCDVNVSFLPSVRGKRSGALFLVTNNQVNVIGLSGIGIPNEIIKTHHGKGFETALSLGGAGLSIAMPMISPHIAIGHKNNKKSKIIMLAPAILKLICYGYNCNAHGLIYITSKYNLNNHAFRVFSTQNYSVSKCKSIIDHDKCKIDVKFHGGEPGEYKGIIFMVDMHGRLIALSQIVGEVYVNKIYVCKKTKPNVCNANSMYINNELIGVPFCDQYNDKYNINNYQY